jgi:hypothetical protein
METDNQNKNYGSSEKDEAEFQRQSMEREKANPHTTENDVLGGLSSGKTPEENREEYQENINANGENKYDNGTAYRKPDSYDNAKGLEMQRQYNEALENQGDTELTDPAGRTTSKTDPSSKDVATDTGYKQNESGEMSGEVTRKRREENLDRGGEEEGGAKDSHGATANEFGNISDEHDITENTKERASIDLTGRSVI